MSKLLLENYIKDIINQSQKDTLHVFDFDMTLYNNDKKSWIQSVILNLKESLNNPRIRVILCTARTSKKQYILDTEFLLKKNNMSLDNFDECYFKSGIRKESAPLYKSHIILNEVYSNNNIKKVKFWDDRQDTLDQVARDLKEYNKDIIYIPVKC